MLRRRFFQSILALIGAGQGVISAPATAASHTVLLQRSRLAGFRYHQAESVWPLLQIGDTLHLVREPHNAHNSNAVRIDWESHTLGYVPRIENHAAAQLLDRNETLTARITALTNSTDPWQRVQFEVLLSTRTKTA